MCRILIFILIIAVGGLSLTNAALGQGRSILTCSSAQYITSGPVTDHGYFLGSFQVSINSDKSQIEITPKSGLMAGGNYHGVKAETAGAYNLTDYEYPKEVACGFLLNRSLKKVTAKDVTFQISEDSYDNIFHGVLSMTLQPSDSTDSDATEYVTQHMLCL